MAHVLIIDDSPTETHKMTGLLKKHGFEVSNAESGQEGVDKAGQIKPDVVLMDVVMPGMNGFQATRLLTRGATTSHIPVIMVTTKDQETDKLWGKRQGAKGYLVKPVDERLLLDAVTRVIKGENLLA